MRRLGSHRINAARSKACKARSDLARLDREIEAAKRAGDHDKAEHLKTQRANVFFNSLEP